MNENDSQQLSQGNIQSSDPEQQQPSQGYPPVGQQPPAGQQPPPGWQQPPAQGYQPYAGQQPNPGYPLQPPPPENKTRGSAIASMVLGIIALLSLLLGIYPLLGLLCSVVGLVLGINARENQRSGVATAGVVLNLIAISLCAIAIVACVTCTGCIITMAR
ncbi:MAG: DUF4190 domain-containing protein [Coriobacteriia bacterium]|nr:DUF4190 domain-containing protein [Coriobacteriia bacterium]